MPKKKKAAPKRKKPRNYIGPRETFCERAEDYCPPRPTFDGGAFGSISNVALGLFLLALISQPSAATDPRLTPGKLKPQRKTDGQADQLTLPGTGAKP